MSEEVAGELHARLAIRGGLLEPAAATRCCRRFREEFGPDVLANLDGEALLMKMHARKDHGHDSLMYWLEFKDDEEFLARFGSIAGGSALKFGIYQAAETGYWLTGSSKKQMQLSVPEAAAAARAQRDQLVGAATVLRDVSSGSGEIDYSALQESLEKIAPDIAESAWGHKYLSLLFPTLLPPIHGTGYEEHQLLKLPGGGRYENARIFAGVAKQLGMTLHDLAATLQERNGGSHRYWRVGTTHETGSEWDRMRLGGFAAVGWSTTGNLSALPHDQSGRAEIRQRLAATSKSEPSAITKAANQIYNFVAGAQPRDIVLAMEGSRVRGVGQIAGSYAYAPDDGPFPHRRPVKWLRFGEWKLPELEGMRTTFVPINKPLNIIETEGRLLGAPVEPGPESRPPRRSGTRSPSRSLCWCSKASLLASTRCFSASGRSFFTAHRAPERRIGRNTLSRSSLHARGFRASDSSRRSGTSHERWARSRCARSIRPMATRTSSRATAPTKTRGNLPSRCSLGSSRRCVPVPRSTRRSCTFSSSMRSIVETSREFSASY